MCHNRKIVFTIAFVFLFFEVFSEDTVLHIYRYENESYGGGMSQYIDIAFYDDGVIKSIYSYWPEFRDKIGPDINAWKNDDFTRDNLKIMWQYPQYNVKRENNVFTVELLRYDEEMNIVEDESDRNYLQYKYHPEEKTISIKDANVFINDDSSFYIQRNNSTIMQYQIDDEKFLYKYSYASSNNYHEYIFKNGYYSQYHYYTVNDQLSKWRYEIEIDNAQNIYNIMSYDSTHPESLFENKYVVRNNNVDVSDYASCLNYFILAGRLRVLLPFVTHTPVVSQKP